MLVSVDGIHTSPPRVSVPSLYDKVGESFAMFCVRCGSKNEPTSRFCASCGTEVATPAEPVVAASPASHYIGPPVYGAHVPQSAAPERPYAGFWFRALAQVIDQVLCSFLTIVVVMPLGFAVGASMGSNGLGSGAEAAGQLLGFVLGSLIGWLWFTLSESSSWQASPGKKLLGLKVTDGNGQRIGFGRANARYWAKLISLLMLMVGFVMAAFTRRKQGLHDLMADTLVVRG
jgi:uncharacterized RDD family membrane protein YckC